MTPAGDPVRLDIVTIFPEYLAPLRAGLLGKAIDTGLIGLHVHDLREWTHDVHRTVDGPPYGGGPGMVMKPEVWGAALDAVTAPSDVGARQQARLIVPTPVGRPFTQALACHYAQQERLVFACGRYEGIDERVLRDAARRIPVDEVSLGDYVLAGGEAAVLVIVEAVARLLPGVLGNPSSAREDSFADEGLLEAPSYTRPEVWRGLEVPEVLRSGHHAAIARWRRDQALIRTYRRRPELLDRLPPEALDAADQAVLDRLRRAE